ncbi:MAG: gliding motility lipoprotein GldH [Ginsengibacter sp.]
MKRFISILIPAVIIGSCIKIDQFEKTVTITSGQWSYNNTPAFTFNITDTNSLYNLYIVLRHTDAYNYNNIWLRLSTQFPGDSARLQNVNLGLANDVKGWEGTGMDDIFEVRKNISRGPIAFKKPGKYTFIVSQIMRENPLKDILDVGVRVEKVNLPQ